MWWLLICIALAGLNVQSKACNCEDSLLNLLNQLNDRVNRVNELIRSIQTKSDLNIRNHYDYFPTMQRAKAALDQSEKIHQQFDKKNSFEQQNQWTKLPLKNEAKTHKNIIHTGGGRWIDERLEPNRLKEYLLNDQQKTRRNMVDSGEWKKDFYEALSTVLQKELKEQPKVRENLGDNFNALKLISKT